MKVIVVRRFVAISFLLVLVFGLGFFSGRMSLPTMSNGFLLSKEMPIFYVETKGPAVCLTFDISWGEKTLPLVLKVLKEHQVPATFFISSPWAVRHPEAVKSIYNDGHEIASHGDRHINLSQYSKEEIWQNIDKAHRELLTIVDKVVPYFRPPNGDYDDLVIHTARELGYETIIWAIDTLDWKNPGPEYMVNRILTKAFPGAIILCHASDSSKQIHLALPSMIQGLRKKGYKLVLLSELMRDGNPARNDPR